MPTSSIVPIEPYTGDSSEGTGNFGILALFISFFTLLYTMYEHFDKRLKSLKDDQDETDARFHVTEDRLATLQDLEEDVRGLKESAEESKDTWEDDIEEPQKFQAIVGTGTVEGIEWEFRAIREKLHTFKENRYWLLKEIDLYFIHHFLFHSQFSSISGKKVSINKNPVWSSWYLNDVDHFIRLEVNILHPKEEEKNEIKLTPVFETARNIDSGIFKWKRVLLSP